MINHARTLLLNKPRSRMHHSDYGYEYVPKDFVPVRLPPTLMTLHKLLFGASPDNYFMNFRANEILTYIHSTELADYIYRLDPRVTYWPKIGMPYFEPASKRVAITQVYGKPQRLSVAGNFAASVSHGRALNTYTLSLRSITDNDVVSLFMDVRYEGKINSLFTRQITDLNAPPIISLPETTLNVRLNVNPYQTLYGNVLTELEEFVVVESYDPDVADKIGTEEIRATPDNRINPNRYVPPAKNILTEIEEFVVTESETLTDPDKLAEEQYGQTPKNQIKLEAQWLIESKANPSPVITTAIPPIELMGEPAFLEIFGLENTEPYLTFKNLWFDHPLPAYKLSGIVLALIYRTQELRGQNG